MNKLRYVKNSNRKAVQADVFHFPFWNESLDGLVRSQVIEYIPRAINMFNEINRVLKKKGILIISALDYSKRTWQFIGYRYKLLLPNTYGDKHITRYTYDSLSSIIASEGI